MKTVNIIRDEFATKDDWQHLETDDVGAALLHELGTWPEGARLYHGGIAQDRDVTPSDDADIAALEKMPGPFFAVLHAGDPWTIGALVVGVLLSAASVLFLTPKIPTIGNQQAGSTNNSLSARQNKPRILGRIPDIFGEVRSTPDDIMLPYRIFDTDSQERELSYYCIGRGEYDVSDVRDGETLVSEIDGESVEVYDPYTSPNSGDPASLTIGDAIATGVTTVIKANGVNGQVLYPPNYKTVDSAVTGNLRFLYPNRIISTDIDALNFTKYLEAGASIVMEGAQDTKDGQTVDLDGTYVIDEVDPAGDLVTLLNVLSVTTDWNKLDLMGADRTNPIPACTIDGSGLSSKWVGPFIINDPTVTGGLANLVALNGLYKSDGSESLPFEITVRFGVTPVDSAGAATGPEVTAEFTLPASGVDKSLKALSAVLTLNGRSSVRALRLTNADYLYQGTVVDEVKWRDLYGTAPLDVTDFGNVTTVQSLTRVTQAAIGVKERKLNMLACRRVPERDGDEFSETLTASKNAADIFCAVALDPYIGRRTLAELNVSAIYDTVDEVAEYFGNDQAAEFGFSFDDDQMSAEEMLDAIARAVFCTPIRRGSVLELVFEKETSDSTLLFNHRNKLPGSEKRTIRFGNLNNFDGVELSYVNGEDYDAKVTYSIPEDGSAANPQKIDTIGVRSFEPAYWHAWRAYSKIRYQRLIAEFTATQEAAAVSRTERILVADNTRPGTQDGEVLGQDGLTLALSRDVTLEDGTDYLILLQISDGSCDVIAITAGAEANEVVLAEAPSSSLSTDIRNAAKAVYWIVEDDDADLGRAFLVSEKRVADRFTYSMSAVNYDARYYSVDRPGSLDFDAIAGNPLIAALFTDF